MLHPWLSLVGNALLLLFGVQLGIAAFFLLPTYVEYARDTQHLGIDLYHILVNDRFTNVAATFCVLYPVPLLCSVGSAHSLRSINTSEPDTTPCSACGCLVEAVVGQQIFFGQLGYAVPPREATIEFLAAIALSSAASRAARDVATSEPQSEIYRDVAATLDRVDTALNVARRAVSQVVSDAEFAVYRAQFAHQVAVSALNLARSVHTLIAFLFDPINTTDATLRRLIEYLVPTTILSTTTIAKDANVALESLDALLNAFSSLAERRQAIRHCALSSSPSSSVCLAMEILLHKSSMVEFMRDALATLKEMVDECTEALDGYLVCASGSQRCTIDVALQVLLSSRPYLVEPGRRTAISQ